MVGSDFNLTSLKARCRAVFSDMPWLSLLVFLGVNIFLTSFVYSQLTVLAWPEWVRHAFVGLLLLFLTALLKLSQVIWLALGYTIGYWFYSWLIRLLIASSHVNDKQFVFWQTGQDGFYQPAFFKELLILLILVLLSQFIRRLWPKVQVFLERWAGLERLILYYLLALSLLEHLPLQRELWQHFGLFGEDKANWSVVVALYPLLFLGLVLSHLSVSAIRGLWKNRSNLSLAILTSLVFAVVASYQLQLPIMFGTALLGETAFSGAMLFQVICLFLTCLFVYLLTNRYLLSTFLLVGLGTLLTVANRLKFDLRQEPLLFTDLIWLKEGDAVLGFVDPELTSKLWFILFGFVVVYLILRLFALKGRLVHHRGKRLVYLAMIASFFVTLTQIFRQETSGRLPEGYPILSRLNNDNPLDWLGFGINAQYKSLTYVWFKQLASKKMEKPAQYSRERVAEVVARYEKLAQEINQSRPNNLTDETLIFLLSESFSDPERVPGVKLSANPLPHIHQIKAQTTSGLMQSDGYGGGTANMEFQSLTGLPYYNFSPSVSVVYVEIVPSLSYIPAISQFYAPEQRIVIHPDSPKNYNRNKVYEQLEFAEFVAHKDTDNPLTAPVAVGALVSDRTVYDNILERMTDESQFFSVITMQNHSPWLLDEPSELTASGEGFSEAANRNLASYVRLLSHTDSETQAFLDQLSELDKRVTVVFYGDHLPGFYPQTTFESQPESQYQTDYFIWSNHDTKRLDYPLINSSDFVAALLEHLEAKVTPYQALLTRVLQEASVDKADLSAEGLAILEDLRVIQYDLTAGKGYILSNQEFFEGNN